MRTFRDYEAFIREQVAIINKEDPNWTWTIKSFAKDRVRIRWSYLDYLEEKDNCFFIKLSNYDEEFNHYFMTARTPQDDMIEGYIIDESDYDLESQSGDDPWRRAFERDLFSAIRNIAYYAHSRY